MAGASFKMNLSSLAGPVALAVTAVKNRQDMAKSIGNMLVSSAIERFEKGEDPEGKKWQVSQRAKDEGGQTLVDKAILKNSITFEASPEMVVVGTNEEYGAIHQYGGQAGRGKKTRIPERPYLGFSEEDAEETVAIMHRFLSIAFGGGR